MNRFEVRLEIYGLALLKKERHCERHKSLIKNSIIAPLSPKLSRSKRTISQELLFGEPGLYSTRPGEDHQEEPDEQDVQHLDQFMYSTPFSSELNAELYLNANYNVYCATT